MELLNELLQTLRSQQAVDWAQWGLVTILSLGAILLTRRILEPRVKANPAFRVTAQITVFCLWILALVVVVVALPIAESRVGQLLSLFGILLSAAIALSSTTFLGNLMAGMMLRSLNSFKLGDFIRVEGFFGRVSEQGFFHTEIQTEDRDLMTIPNLFLVTNPVTVVRSDGTVLTSLVSLGYDVPRSDVEPLLLKAAEKAGLSDAFVSVMELGDFSVVYRVAGLLPQVTELLSRRSRLRKCVLDALHEADIEIMSPNFVNVRTIDHAPVIPERRRAQEHAGPAPEAMLFVKADQAAGIQTMRDLATAVDHELLQIGVDLNAKPVQEEKERLEARKKRLELQLERLKETIARREQDIDGG